MLLYEANAPDVARLVFKASRNIRRFTHEREIDDLIQVETLYLSCDGNLLFAYGKQPKFVYEEKEPRDPVKAEVGKWKDHRIPKRITRGASNDYTATAVSEDELQIEQIAFDSDCDYVWLCENDNDSQIQEESAEISNNTIEDENNWNETSNWTTTYVEYDPQVVEEPMVSSEYTKTNGGIWTVHPNWATQPFGWDDSEVVDYTESEEEEDDTANRIRTQMHVEDVPYAVQRDDGTFECSKCNDGRTFQHLSNVWRHSEQHREKSSICAYCGAGYQPKRLPYHEFDCRKAPPRTVFKKRNMSIRSDVDVRGASCPECSKGSFRSPVEYFDHLNTHSGEQPYVCSCGNSRSRQYANFWNHRRKHKCPLEGCSYPAYAERIVLKLPFKKPTKEAKNEQGERISKFTGKSPRINRKYPNGHICEHCNKRFTNASRLAFHRAQHHMERTIPCPEDDCAEMFANQTLLKKHIKSHLFLNKCDLCGMVFRIQMSHHMWMYHPKFHCKPCSFKSNSKSRYEEHLKSEKHASRCGDENGESNETTIVASDGRREQFTEPSVNFDFIDG